MRIFFFTSKLNFRASGGSVEEIDYIIRNLQALGHEVTAVTAYSERNDVPDALPYRIIEEHFGTQRLFGMQKSIYRALCAHEKDADAFIVDAHNFMYGAGFYRLMGGTTPVSATVNQFLACWPQYESSYFPQPHRSIITQVKSVARFYIEKFIGSWLANYVDVYAFVSPNVRTTYEKFWMRHRPQDIVIGDPIDWKGLMQKAEISESSYRAHLKSAGPLAILYSSRMSPGKGFDMLLQGFSRVKNKEDFRLILGGSGPEEQYVRKMVHDLGLERYVTLPGWVSKEQLLEYYKQADIFIQADWWPTGTSISLLYAVAFGLPSILPGGGGLQWNAGKGALYFPYRDPEALARRIEELGAHPELRAELSAHCYERLKQSDVDYPALIKEFAQKLSDISSRGRKLSSQ